MLVCGSVHALLSPEEQRQRAGAGVAADGGADVVDERLPVHPGESGFHQLGHSLRILQTGGMAQVALAAVAFAVLCMLLHLRSNFTDNLVLAANLEAGHQFAFKAHIVRLHTVQKTVKIGIKAFTLSIRPPLSRSAPLAF